MEKNKLDLYRQAFIYNKRTIFDYVKSTYNYYFDKYLDAVNKLQSIGCINIAMIYYKLGKSMVSGVYDNTLYTIYSDGTLSMLPLDNNQMNDIKHIWDYHKRVF